MDKNGNGTLSFDEFRDSNKWDIKSLLIAFDEFQKTAKIKKKLDDNELKRLFKTIDANGNGVIDYSGKNIDLYLIVRILGHLCWKSPV